MTSWKNRFDASGSKGGSRPQCAQGRDLAGGVGFLAGKGEVRWVTPTMTQGPVQQNFHPPA